MRGLSCRACNVDVGTFARPGRLRHWRSLLPVVKVLFSCSTRHIGRDARHACGRWRSAARPSAHPRGSSARRPNARPGHGAPRGSARSSTPETRRAIRMATKNLQRWTPWITSSRVLPRTHRRGLMKRRSKHRRSRWGHAGGTRRARGRRARRRIRQSAHRGETPARDPRGCHRQIVGVVSLQVFLFPYGQLE